MKMKKLAAFALASMLVVTSLTGCGGSNDKGSNSKAKTEETGHDPGQEQRRHPTMGRLDEGIQDPVNSWMILLAMCLTSWCGTARQMRGMIMQLRESEYVMAAETLGGSPSWIIRKHLIGSFHVQLNLT